MRLGGAARKLVQNKRKAGLLNPYKNVTAITNKPKVAVIDLSEDSSSRDQTEEEKMESEEKTRDSYCFRPGRVPPFRQMFYQYRNIELPEMNILLQNYRGAEEDCDEKNGWYKPGLDSTIRDTIADLIKKNFVDDDSMSLGSSMNISYEGAVDNDDFDSDDNMDVEDE